MQDEGVVRNGSSLQAESLAVEAAVAVVASTRGVSPQLRCVAEQAVRAVASTPLNLAEGAGRAGRDRVQHYRIAYGSCREASAAMRLLVATGAVPKARGDEALALLDRVQAMTWRLMHPKR